MKSKVLVPLIISEIKSGNSPSQISKKHNISLQNLNYYLGKMKKDGLITKVDYGVWKVLKELKKTSKASQDKKEIRGHGFNWRIKLKRKYDWIKHLNKRNLSYKMIGINSSTPRIIFRNKKIWLTQTGMVIYEPMSFFEKDGITAKKTAVYELKNTIELLGRKMSIDFTNQWGFTTSREHFGQIKNALAKQYNDKGEKIYIKDDKGIWLWIDDSHSLSELETTEPLVSKQVQNWYNDHKKHKFEVSPSWILNAFNQSNNAITGLTQTQVMNANNIIKHQKVLDGMLEQQRQETELRKEMLNTMKDIRENLKK